MVVRRWQWNGAVGWFFLEPLKLVVYFEWGTAAVPHPEKKWLDKICLVARTISRIFNNDIL